MGTRSDLEPAYHSVPSFVTPEPCASDLQSIMHSPQPILTYMLTSRAQVSAAGTCFCDGSELWGEGPRNFAWEAIPLLPTISIVENSVEGRTTH